MEPGVGHSPGTPAPLPDFSVEREDAKLGWRGGPPPGESHAGSGTQMMNRDRFESAADFETYLGMVEKNREFWRGVWDRVVIPSDVLARAGAPGGTWHLLALSEDWCGDAVNLLPLVARLAQQVPGLSFRVLGRDANLDLMDAHLTGSSRSIPVVILYDDAFRERGWWGPRPAPLQRWVREVGLKLPSDERYREIRKWYARDRGRTTLEEIAQLMESASREPAIPSGSAAAEGRGLAPVDPLAGVAPSNSGSGMASGGEV